MRVALERVPWPLDPALARTRDETTLVRTLFSTPLRVDRHSGDVVPGLCTSWHASNGARTWTFRCRAADEIARELRHVEATPASPGQWLFTGARIDASGDELRVRLPFGWLRFPYALTSAAAAPPSVPGPFRVVRARPGTIVARRRGLTVVLRQLQPARAAVLFRRGELDEAPVPLGDIRAALADGTVRQAVHVRPILAVDVVTFDLRRGALALLPKTRRAYWQTADRGDYQALVPENETPAAVSVVPGSAPPRTPARAFRAAKGRIPSLPRVRVRVVADDDPTIRYGASLLVASWGDLGLGPKLVTRNGDARFERLRAQYPQDESLLAALVEPRARARLLGALVQEGELQLLDDALFRSAAVVPVAWAADARFVSPRVHGWSEDRLGDVDYARVRLNPGR